MLLIHSDDTIRTLPILPPFNTIQPIRARSFAEAHKPHPAVTVPCGSEYHSFFLGPLFMKKSNWSSLLLSPWITCSGIPKGIKRFLFAKSISFSPEPLSIIPASIWIPSVAYLNSPVILLFRPESLMLPWSSHQKCRPFSTVRICLYKAQSW